jgi:hypothetical protein
MILNEQALPGEEEVSKEKAGKLEEVGSHTIRKGSDGKYYAKKKSATAPKQETKPETQGNQQTTVPECEKNKTPFTNQNESDAFRTWLLTNYPDFSKKPKPYNVSPAPSKFLDSKALRCAWFEKGEEYKKQQTPTTNGQTQSTAPETEQDQTTQSGFEKGEKEKLEKKVKEAENEAIRRHCSPWVVDNFFERDFESKANEMAQQFVKFCEVDPRIPSSIYDYNVNLYNICAESYKDYVSKGEAHKSPFVLVMSKQKVSNSKFKDKLPNSKSMITSYEAWKSTLPTNESKIIRKKLIEHKQMKTIKETVNKKLSDKTKKVDVISENLYKVAGSFYNEKYDVFFKKIEKLTENYQKSKLFLNEDASDSFNRAIIKVFKGDEDRLKNEAIPFFMNKLGLEGKVRSQVETELGKKYNADNIGNMFLDCWADIVVQSFKDNAKSEISEPSNVMDAIEKIMMSKIDTPEFDYQLKKEICKMLKPSQEGKQSKVQDLAKKINQFIINLSES